MNAILTIARREIRALFDQPTAYILLVVFTAVNGFLFFRQVELYGVASLRPMLDILPWLMLFFVPAVTMRALAEDARSGTLEVVLAQPITEVELLCGKYAGQVLFLVSALALTLTLPLGLALGARLAFGVLVAQYVGATLLIAGLAGVGVWASSITRNQITAFILAVAVMFVLILVGLDPLLVGLPPRLGAVAASLGVLSHFTGIARGVIDLRDAVYFVTLGGLFLLLAYFALMRRRLTARGEPLRRLRLGTALIAAALIVLNLFGRRIGGRLDLTPGRAFTLSPATKQILRRLPDILTIKLFASSALPPEVDFLKRDLDDLLRDYRASGRGKVKLVVQDPSADSAALREARNLGIPAVQFNVLGRAELQVKEGYLGIAVRYADGVKTIPFVRQTEDLEYRLTSDIRSLTRAEKPVIGWGEISDAAAARGQRAFGALREQLEQNYTVRPVALTDTSVATDVKVLAYAGTPDSLRGGQGGALKAFLGRGGSLLLMSSGMELSTQGPFAFSRRVGWNELLEPYGVAIRSDMVYDLASNERVAVPAQFGQVLVPYPFWLRVLSTKASTMNAELEGILLPWASTIDTTKAPPGRVAPLFVSSRAGGVQETTAMLDPSREFRRDSLAMRLVAVMVNPLASDSAGVARGRLVIVGSSDFASDRYARNSPENVAFVQNAVDWLAQDEALIGIRSKNRAPPQLVFTSATRRDAAKYGNIVGVPALLILAGSLRLWRRRQITRQAYRPLPVQPAAETA